MKKRIFFTSIIICVCLLVYWFMPPFWLPSKNIFIAPLRFVINPPTTAYSSENHDFPAVSGFSKTYKKGSYQFIYKYRNTNAYWLSDKEKDVLWKNNWVDLSPELGIQKKGSPIGDGMCIKTVKNSTYISFTKPSSDSINYPCDNIP